MRIKKGTCLDNSSMENFFGIMKQEMYYGKIYKSFEELKLVIEWNMNLKLHKLKTLE